MQTADLCVLIIFICGTMRTNESDISLPPQKKASFKSGAEAAALWMERSGRQAPSVLRLQSASHAFHLSLRLQVQMQRRWSQMKYYTVTTPEGEDQRLQKLTLFHAVPNLRAASFCISPQTGLFP